MPSWLFGSVPPPTSEPAVELRIIDARLDEVKRFGAVLQRKGQLTGSKATHFHNRVQSLEIARAEATKASSTTGKSAGGVTYELGHLKSRYRSDGPTAVRRSP